MPCIRQDARRGPGRPRVKTATLPYSRTTARLPRSHKRGSASSKDYNSDSDSDFGGLQSASDSDLEYDFADIDFQSDSDSDLESDFADVDPQSGSTFDPDCNVISLASGGDLGYNSDRTMDH